MSTSSSDERGKQLYGERSIHAALERGKHQQLFTKKLLSHPKQSEGCVDKVSWENLLRALKCVYESSSPAQNDTPGGWLPLFLDLFDLTRTGLEDASAGSRDNVSQPQPERFCMKPLTVLTNMLDLHLYFFLATVATAQRKNWLHELTLSVFHLPLVVSDYVD